MKKVLLFSILITISCNLFGQLLQGFGGNRTSDTAYKNGPVRIDGLLRLLAYSNTDSTLFLTVDASGYVHIAKPGAGQAGSGTVTSIIPGIGLKSTQSPLTTSGTLYYDSIIIASHRWVDSFLLAAYQPLLGYTPENNTNKATSFGTINNTLYPTTSAVNTLLNSTLASYLTTASAAGLYVALGGSYSNPVWLNSLAWSKITGTPTTLAGYGITDWSGHNGQYLGAGPSGFVWYTFPTIVGALTTSTLLLNPSIGYGSSVAVDLPTVGTSGTWGNGALIPAFTTDSYGRITGVNTVTVTPAFSHITGLPTTLFGYGITDAYPLTGNPSGFLTTVNVASPITSTGGPTPTIGLNGSWVGQTSITTLGTITTGIWHGTAIADGNIASASNWNQAYHKYAVSGSYSSGTITFTNNDATTWTVTGLPQGTVTSIATSSPLTGGTITGSGTIGLGTVGFANGGNGATTSWTAGSILFAGASALQQDNNNLYWNAASHILSVNTNGDFTGTDAINVYGQIDHYQTNSAQGAVNSTTMPGTSTSSSRGTGASPVINNSGDIIGNNAFWAYTATSPAYYNMCGVVGKTAGSGGTNGLGGELDFYVKADNSTTYTNAMQILTSGHYVLEGVTTTGATGTGNLVFATSPTFTTPLLGTPTSGNLANCTGYTYANLSGTMPSTTLTGDITGSGSGSFATTLATSGVTAGTYGSATATPVITFDAKGRATTVTTVNMTSPVTASNTITFTNKRTTARTQTITTVSATPAFNTDNYDIFEVTAQAVNITSLTTNLTGTPVDGDIVEFQITATGSLTFAAGTSFVNSSVSQPTTLSTTTITIVYQYFATSSYGNNKWVCVNSF